MELPVKGAAECDMLEAEERTLDVAKEGTRLSFMPFEIKTVKLMLSKPIESRGKCANTAREMKTP